MDVEKRYGVELNGHAREQIEAVYPGKITTFTFIEMVPDESVDL